MSRTSEYWINVRENRWSRYTEQEIQAAQRLRQINEAWQEEEEHKS